MEHIQRIIENLFGRLDGPLHFRFILQPLMAALFAIIDGLKDAKAVKPAYFWAMITNSEHRKELIKDGWKHVGKIFILLENCYVLPLKRFSLYLLSSNSFIRSVIKSWPYSVIEYVAGSPGFFSMLPISDI